MVDRSNNIIVGREDHLAFLHDIMDKVEASKGTSVLLTGEAGIGKTTIGRRAVADARGRGWTVMSSECLFGEGGEPYFPIIRAIQDYIEGPDESEAARSDCLDSAPPTLPSSFMGMADTEEGPKSVSGAELRMERDRMFEHVSDLLLEASTINPVLLFIDDLHWADNSTLQLLYYIIRTSIRDRVLVMGAYRPEDVESSRTRHPMSDFLGRSKREGLIQEMEVGRFGEEDTRQLVDSMAKGDLPTSFAKKVHGDTGGNPYIIKEFMLALEDMASQDEDTLSIPSSVSTFILDRVHRFDEEEQRLLQLGSVLGQEFRYSLMVGSSGIDEETVINMLERLVVQKVLEEREELVGDEIFYRFTHNLIREVIYNHMSRTKRRLLHKKVGECLEKQFVKRPETIVYPLAYHFSRTADQAKAFEYLTMAGKMANKAFAFDDALELMESALDVLLKLEHVVDAERKEMDILSTMGNIHNFLGNTNEALEYHNSALALTPDGSVERAMAQRNIAEVELESGDWKRSFKNFERAIRISEALDDTTGMAEGYRGLAWLSAELGQHDKALEYGERCLKEAKRSNNTYLQGKVLLDLGNSFNIRNDTEKALQYYDDALNVLDHTKHLDQLSRVYNNTGDIYMKMRQYDQAKDCFMNCLEIARVTGDGRRLSYGMTNLGLCLGSLGQAKEGLDYLNKAEAIFTRSGDKYGITIVNISTALVLRNSGDLEEGERLLRIAIELSKKHDFKMLEALAEIEYGVLLKRAGRKEEALEQLEKGLHLKTELERTTRVGSLQEGLDELMEMKNGK